MSKLIRIACLAMIGAAGSVAYAAGQQEIAVPPGGDEPATLVQTSVTEAPAAAAKRQLDLYGLWKFSANTQLRVSANNLLAEDYTTERFMIAPDGYVSTTAPTRTTVGVRLEMKL